ncbi:hypothetical protein HDV02_004289, partial [Globomyces sp. JEL0801]
MLNENSPTTNDSTASKSLSIDFKLSRKNYPLWRFKMLPMLERLNLATNATKEGKEVVTLKENATTLSALTINLSDEITADVMHLKTPQSIWDYLEKLYYGVSYSRKVLGIQKLCGFRYESGSISDSVASLRRILTEIRTASQSSEITYEEIAISMLLQALPSDFQNIRSSIINEKITNLDQATDRLLKEEDLIKTNQF